MGGEIWILIVPIILLGWALADKEQKEREAGIRPSARKSKNLVDWMFYDFNMKD